jgi:hypothetical protein
VFKKQLKNDSVIDFNDNDERLYIDIKVKTFVNNSKELNSIEKRNNKNDINVKDIVFRHLGKVLCSIIKLYFFKTERM